MNASTLKSLARLATELAVLLAIYLLGCQMAVWFAWPIPGGVIGMVLLLLAFALGVVKPAALQMGAGLLMAEMLLFFIPALMSLLDYGGSAAQRRLANFAGDRRQHADGDAGDRLYRGTGGAVEEVP